MKKNRRRFVVKASRNARNHAKGRRIMATRIIVDGVGEFNEITDAISAIEKSSLMQDYENGDISSIQYTVISDDGVRDIVDADVSYGQVVYDYYVVMKRDYVDEDWEIIDSEEYATFEDAERAARKLADEIGYDLVGVTNATGTLSETYGTNADYEFDEDGDLVEVY